MQALCVKYGIPDTQRAQCAAEFTRSDVRTALREELESAQAKREPIRWTQFRKIMIHFDGE